MPEPALKRVEELFHQALALDPAERPSFLEVACGGDTRLRAAVLDVLKHHTAGRDTDDFLVSPLARAAGALGPEAPTQRGEDSVREPSPGAPWPRVPGYEILRELGRGGMGVVYQARQVGLGRVVALKMLLPLSPVTPEQLARFRTEAEALARLHHPNVVPIYDSGECEGQPYFTMAYVPGPSLDRLIDGRAQDVGHSARLVEVLARAVHTVHECGIVHRDLKPANVLLWPTAGADPAVASFPISPSASGVPMVSDFGLATDRAADRRLTVSGTTLGTPAYMAPEQVRGRSGAVGPAADVYALGSILYELLTGRPPFNGATPADTVAQLLRDEPLSPSQLRPRLPRDLVTVCLKCLEKSPRRRYASALDLAEDLRRFRAGEPILARPVGPAERAHRWCRRQPLAAALLALSGALAGAFVVTVLVYNARLKEALAAVEALAEDRRRQIVQLNVTVGIHELERGDGFTACLRFTEALRLDDSDPDRVRGYHARIATALRQCPRLIRLTTLGQPVLATHLEGPEAVLATVGDGPTVEVWDLSTGRPVGPALKHDATPVGGAFSPDGRVLATVGTDGTVAVWDLRAGTARRLPPGGRKPVRSVSFLAGGRTLLTGHGESGMTLWDLSAPGPVPLLDLSDSPVGHAALSENGRRLFTADAVGTGQVWDTATGKAAGPPVRPGRALARAALSPDGRLLALVDVGGTLRFWDVATAQPLGGPMKSGVGVDRVAFSPEADRVLTAGGDAAVRIWRVPTGELATVLPRYEGMIRHARFSPDGRFIMTAGPAGARVWDTATGRSASPPLRHGAPLASGAFVEGGQRLVTVGQGGTVCAWELPRPGQSEQWIADLARDERPIGDLMALAQLLACGRIDETQTQVGLDPERLRAVWRQLRPAP
jgi:WD40 repeat protein